MSEPETVIAGMHVGQVLQTLTVAGVIGAWRSVVAFQRRVEEWHHKMERWQTRIDMVIFGADGNNGINGLTKDLAKRVHSLETEDDE